MNVDLLYGRNSIPLHLPENIRVTVVRKHPMIPIRNPDLAVTQAFESPVGSPPLAEMARGRKSACILICDITRPVPNGTLLPLRPARPAKSDATACPRKKKSRRRYWQLGEILRACLVGRRRLEPQTY